MSRSITWVEVTRGTRTVIGFCIGSDIFRANPRQIVVRFPNLSYPHDAASIPARHVRVLLADEAERAAERARASFPPHARGMAQVNRKIIGDSLSDEEVIARTGCGELKIIGGCAE
jgi:hypothetical protein